MHPLTLVLSSGTVSREARAQNKKFRDDLLHRRNRVRNVKPRAVLDAMIAKGLLRRALTRRKLAGLTSCDATRSMSASRRACSTFCLVNMFHNNKSGLRSVILVYFNGLGAIQRPEYTRRKSLMATTEIPTAIPIFRTMRSIAFCHFKIELSGRGVCIDVFLKGVRCKRYVPACSHRGSEGRMLVAKQA